MVSLGRDFTTLGKGAWLHKRTKIRSKLTFALTHTMPL
jgi:hypothetical protein